MEGTSARRVEVGVGIHLMPDEMLQRIFSFLDVYDVVVCQVTCKRWRRITQSDLGLWNSLPQICGDADKVARILSGLCIASGKRIERLDLSIRGHISQIAYEDHDGEQPSLQDTSSESFNRAIDHWLTILPVEFMKHCLITVDCLSTDQFFFFLACKCSRLEKLEVKCLYVDRERHIGLQTTPKSQNSSSFTRSHGAPLQFDHNLYTLLSGARSISLRDQPISYKTFLMLLSHIHKHLQFLDVAIIWPSLENEEENLRNISDQTFSTTCSQLKSLRLRWSEVIPKEPLAMHLSISAPVLERLDLSMPEINDHELLLKCLPSIRQLSLCIRSRSTVTVLENNVGRLCQVRDIRFNCVGDVSIESLWNLATQVTMSMLPEKRSETSAVERPSQAREHREGWSLRTRRPPLYNLQTLCIDGDTEMTGTHLVEFLKMRSCAALYLGIPLQKLKRIELIDCINFDASNLIDMRGEAETFLHRINTDLW